MPRPPCCRRVSSGPAVVFFTPTDNAPRRLEQVLMTLDEFEAIKLADHEGLYQEEAALRMGVSRPTFGRIVTAARRKVAHALVAGKALRIEGGSIASESCGRPRCHACHLEQDKACDHAKSCSHCQCPGRAASQTDSTRSASPSISAGVVIVEKLK